MISQLIANGIIIGSTYSLIAIGFTIIYKTVNFFHLAHAGVYTFAAYIYYSLINSKIWSFLKTDNHLLTIEILSFSLSIFLSGLLGTIIDKFIYFPLRKKEASQLSFLLASFGVLVIIQNLLQIIYGTEIFILNKRTIIEGYKIFGATITITQIIILFFNLLFIMLTSIFIYKTKLGKFIRAVSDNYILSKILGINTELVISLSFFFGSLIAGTAGILISYETNLEPTIGFNIVFKGIVASIIGGTKSFLRCVIAGFFIGIIENISIWKLDSNWKDFITFFIMIVFLLLKPQKTKT